MGEFEEKDYDEDSSSHRNVIESRGWWKPGTSMVGRKITSESQTEIHPVSAVESKNCRISYVTGNDVCGKNPKYIVTRW